MGFRWQQLRLPIAGWLVAVISYLAVSYWVLQRSVDRGGTLASWPAAVIALGWLLLLGAALMRNATRQRQSQDELRAIQKRLQLVLSATPGISYSTLLADGKTSMIPGSDVTYVSDNIVELLGYAPHEIVEQPEVWLQLIHPDDRPRLLEQMQSALQQELHVLEYRLQHRQGHYICVRNDVRIVRDPSGRPVECVGFVLDVTQQKTAQQEIAAGAKRLRDVLDSIFAFVVLMRTDGHVLDINRAPLESSGRRREEIVGMPVWETDGFRSFPSEQQRVRSAIKRAAAGEAVREDYMYQTAQGNVVTVEGIIAPLYNPEGRIDALIGSAIDVSQRKLAEDALRASESRLRLLLDIAALATSTLHLDQLLDRLMNRFTEVIPTADLGAIYLYDQRRDVLYPAACRGADVEAYRRLELAPGESITGKVFAQGMTVRTTSKEETAQLRGSLREVNRKHYLAAGGGKDVQSAIATPLTTPNGHVIGALTMGSTQLAFSEDDLALLQGVAAYAAIAVQNAQMFQQQRESAAELERVVQERTADLQKANAELESFAQTVAHDLRAPLRAMHGFAVALLEDCSPQLGDTGREYANYLIGSAQRMDGLINDLLAYSQVGRDELLRTVVDLDQVVSEVVHQMGTEISNRHATVEIDRPLPAIVAHRSTVGQVVTNLLNNAIKFVAPDRQPRVRLFSERRGPKCRLWVEDNGIGVPPEFHDRIFRVFERLHGIETYPGTGIGLAIVGRACARMGGACGVESRPGAGSRFWVEFAAAN